MNERLKAGFRYTFEVIKNGEVIDRFVEDNLMPTEGVNHMLSTELKAGTQVTAWYIGLFEGNYTPVIGDTAALFPGAATECTAYASATRVAFTPGTVSGGAVDNSASVANFAMNASKTVYGAFMSSVSGKGSTSGVLLSAVRFSSPRVLDADSTLAVTAGITITSL